MKCITLNGALYRVENRFDETEGSEDMRALIELDAAIRGRLKETHGGGPQELTKTPKKKRGER